MATKVKGRPFFFVNLKTVGINIKFTGLGIRRIEEQKNS